MNKHYIRGAPIRGMEFEVEPNDHHIRYFLARTMGKKPVKDEDNYLLSDGTRLEDWMPFESLLLPECKKNPNSNYLPVNILYFLRLNNDIQRY